MSNVIITSHGFGVRQDSNGFFPSLAQAVDSARFILFDYNEVLPNGDCIVPSLFDQAKILELAIEQTDSEDITILAHSQGCVVASLAKLSKKVKRVILLAPPVNMSSKHLESKFSSRPGANINREGTSVVPRTDGTTTYFTKGYVESVDAVDPMTLYKTLAEHKPTMIIRATEDEIIGLTNVNEIPGADHHDMKTDHNFTTEGARNHLAEMIEKTLA